jgi:hypothetical protein
MKKLLLILLLPFTTLVAEQTVTLDSAKTITTASPTIDLTQDGGWFIHFSEDRWEKLGAKLYPDKTDRTQSVIDAQDAVKSNMNTYVKEAIENDEYTVVGDGLDLTAITQLNYNAGCFKDGSMCDIIIRHNNKLYTIKLFPTIDNETAAATTARAAIAKNLGTIETAANTGGHYE